MENNKSQTIDFREQQNRAVKFIKKHKDDKKENAESQIFWNDFFSIFGIDAHESCEFEKPVKIPDRPNSRIDCFMPNKIIIEQKSLGKDLNKAKNVQAEEYYYYIDENERPNHILVCDFKTFILTNKVNNFERIFVIEDLVKQLHIFKFLIDDSVEYSTEDIPLTIKASELMAKIYNRLEATKYKKEDREEFLVRLVYCLFADDTGIFEKNIFHKFIKSNKNKSLGPKLGVLFDVLDTPYDERQTILEKELKQFPYINGDLFQNKVQSLTFDKEMFSLLMKASEFDWHNVSPAIFGSLFQYVMDKDQRRHDGAHYTTEENILKVIKPLFLDDLRNEFNSIKENKTNSRIKKLNDFHDKISKLTFFDPACGSGNFLIVTYKEIRKLEIAILNEMNIKNKVLDVSALIKINVNQFYGIEINKFSAKIAETALWIMDHVMNNHVSARYGQNYIRIPLLKHPNITNADALELDWNKVLLSKDCDYVLGNPPFGGSKTMSADQREQIKNLANLGGGGGTLDHVAGWILKSAQYVNDTTLIGFVSTNSITQGEQVGQLWPQVIEKYGLEIIFAYKQFKWYSEVKDKAQVIVVIIGLGKNIKKKRLFGYNENGNVVEDNPKYISPYLRGDLEYLPVVHETSKPLNGLSKIKMGSKSIDGGNYIFTDEERIEFLKKEPNAKSFLRPFVSAYDFLRGSHRWILVLHDIKPNELMRLPEIKKRVELVKAYRSKSTDAGTRKLAERPLQYHLNVIPSKPFLMIPRVSSERRKYVPLGYLLPPNIPSDASMIIENASLELFGLLISGMHMVWLRIVGGKLESRFRYSAGMVYNTFPVPEGKVDTLESHAQKILDIRKKYPDSTLVDLYDPTSMPLDLKKAHQSLDKVVEKLYRKESFESDEERIEYLLKEYQKMTNKQARL